MNRVFTASLVWMAWGCTDQAEPASAQDLPAGSADSESDDDLANFGAGEATNERAAAPGSGCLGLEEPECRGSVDCRWRNGECQAASTSCSDFKSREPCRRAGCGWTGECVETCHVELDTGACVASCAGENCRSGPDVCGQCCGTCTTTADCGSAAHCSIDTPTSDDLPSCDGSAQSGFGHCIADAYEPAAVTDDLECIGCAGDDDCGGGFECSLEVCSSCYDSADNGVCGGTCQLKSYADGLAEGAPDQDGKQDSGGNVPAPAEKSKTCCYESPSNSCAEACDEADSDCYCSQDVCGFCGLS